MQSLLDPTLLFFAFGVFAGAIRSNLEIPQPIAKFLSLYLLMALGLKGGFALRESGLSPEIALSLSVAITMAVLVPILGYLWLRTRCQPFDAAAVAASFGSVSAVTFVTAMQFIEQQGIPANGYMAMALVIMESPAIILAVLFAAMVRQTAGVAHTGVSVKRVLHEAFTDGAHLLLLASMLIGLLTGPAGEAVMEPFSGDLFKGMLAFFLLDMGLLVAKHFREASKHSGPLVVYALIAPFVHALIALILCDLLGIPLADTILLMVLAASASYIVVPAVLREAIPEANPSLYFGLSIGLTFPVNILLGIPLYTGVARWWLGIG